MEGKNKHFIVYILFIIFFLFLFWTYTNRPFEVRNIEVKFRVNDSIGVDLRESDELNFGSLILGGVAVRNLVLENKKDFPIEVRIYVSKSIEDFLIASDTVIPFNSTIKLPLKIQIPMDIPYGDYNGKIRLEFKRKR